MSNSTCLLGTLGAWALFQGVKQGEPSKRCSEKQLAFLSVQYHPRGSKTRMQEIQCSLGIVTSYEPWDTGALVAKGLGSRAGVVSAPTGTHSHVRFQIRRKPSKTWLIIFFSWVAALGLWGNGLRFFGDDAT